MASLFKDQKLMFLVAAAITVVATGILIANVQDSSGQGVKVSNDTLDQLTSIIIQLMVVFWVALIGYFVYKYLTTRERYRSKGERRAGEGRNMLPYAFVLLALWLILFVVSPLGGSGLFTPPEPINRNAQTNSTFPTDQPTRDLPLAFPLIIVIIAVASIVVVWRFLRRSEAPRVNMANQAKDEEAKAVLDAAVRSLYAGEDPRSTIIRTYQRMCLLVQVGKLDDEPYLTPREFADRAVGALGWKRAPLEDLTELFEEARYSAHVLGEAEKERAIAAFERVREGLGGGPIAGTAH
jgi:flagellar basal body-associated protein FliL